MAPIAKCHDSYSKDTQDFLEKLNKTTPSEKSLLVTLDEDSLYTNIDNKDGMEAVKKAFENNPNEKRPDRQILKLLEIYLKNYDFEFNDEWFLQVGGTDIG